MIELVEHCGCRLTLRVEGKAVTSWQAVDHTGRHEVDLDRECPFIISLCHLTSKCFTSSPT
jgi:hypothetical protein